LKKGETEKQAKNLPLTSEEKKIDQAWQGRKRIFQDGNAEKYRELRTKILGDVRRS